MIEDETTQQETPLHWSPSAVPGIIEYRGKHPIAKWYNPNTQKYESCSQCAQWANGAINKANIPGFTLTNAVTGNAWTRLSTGDMILNGYQYVPKLDIDDATKEAYDKYVKSGKEPWGISWRLSPRSKFGRQAQQRNFAAADSLKTHFDENQLDTNRTYMVNMFYKDSPYTGVAAVEGLDDITGTHTGNMYWDTDSQKWKVVHNIHKQIIDESVEDILGSKTRKNWGVTAISEVPTKEGKYNKWASEHPFKAGINKIFGISRKWKQGGSIKKFGNPSSTLVSNAEIVPATITGIQNSKVDSKLGQRFISSLNKLRPEFISKYNLTDDQYSDLMAFAINIAKKESDFGDSLRYKIKNEFPAFIKSGIRAILLKDPTVSRGISQVKIFPGERKTFKENGVKIGRIDDDPEQMARATLVKSLINSNELGDKEYHYSDGTLISPEDVAAVYWNYGRITDNLNDNPETTKTGGASGYIRRYEHQKVVK